jgi:GAF domain-containing protein
MPITVRGITVSVIEFDVPDSTPIADATLDALKILSERIGMIAENARLFDAVLQSAQYQAQLNQVTARLQGISDVEVLLGTMIAELGQVLGAQQGYIRLVSENTGNGQSE